MSKIDLCLTLIFSKNQLGVPYRPSLIRQNVCIPYYINQFTTRNITWLSHSTLYSLVYTLVYRMFVVIQKELLGT